MDTKHQNFFEIADSTAKHFAHRCWWADRDDLRNEAYMSLLEYFDDPPPHFKPEHEHSIRYARTIVSRHMSKYCFRQGYAVSGRLRRDSVGTTCRVSLNDSLHQTGDLEAEVIALEAAALVPELHAELRARLRVIFFETFQTRPTNEADAAIDVLIEGMRSQDAATEYDLPIRKVYHQTEKVKARACTDRTVRALLTQISQSRGDLHDYA